MRALTHALRPTCCLLLAFALLFGAGYSGGLTLLAMAAFPFQAGGSVWKDGQGPVGSALLGQEFSDPKYLWGRLSATVPPYNPMASAGSNFAMGHPELLKNVQKRVDRLRAADPANTRMIPVDLVTASASGVDPQISFAAADFQAGRIARLRGMREEQVRAAYHACASDRLMGWLGEPIINVLCVNLTLDDRAPRK